MRAPLSTTLSPGSSSSFSISYALRNCSNGSANDSYVFLNTDVSPNLSAKLNARKLAKRGNKNEIIGRFLPQCGIADLFLVPGWVDLTEQCVSSIRRCAALCVLNPDGATTGRHVRPLARAFSNRLGGWPRLADRPRRTCM